MAAAAFLLAIAAGCSGKGENATPAAAPNPAAMAVPVELVTLAEKPVEQTGEFVGTVKSRRSTSVQPQAEGFLTKILVKSGDRVSPGTVLFEIDSANQQAAVAGLESVRSAREADAMFAKQQAERAKSLLGVGAASQQEYEQAAAQQKAADAQLKAIEEQIKQQRVELNYHRVTASTSGMVGDVPVRQGDRVTRGTVLTTIDDYAGLEVYINVPVQQAPTLKVGLPVRIIGENREIITTERINFISPSVDDTTQTVLVKTALAASGSRFRTDQFVRTVIVFSTAPALTVPITAVTRVQSQYFVFVAEPGQGGVLFAHQRSIKIGPVSGNEYVVLSGVKAGDQLVTAGTQKIGDGAPVRGGGPPSAPPGAAGGGS